MTGSQTGWLYDNAHWALARELLRGMMTNAHFYVKLGGHSPAAGHGERGRQCWSLPFLESDLLCRADGTVNNATHYYYNS